MNKKKLVEHLEWYFLLLVPIVGTIVFNLYPLFKTLLQTFFNMNEKFIGFVNYQIVFSDKEFWQSIYNTVYIGILATLVEIPLAFILANMVNNVKHGQNVVKIFFLVPTIMSAVVIAVVFRFLFSPQEGGIANYILSLLGFPPLAWFNATSTARETVALMSIWRFTGYSAIIFFAGLQTIPVELYEAATIDGANEKQKWLYITIPGVRNTFIFVYMTACINMMKRFTDVFTIGYDIGNPGGVLSTIILYIYRKTFSTMFYRDDGVASVASVLLFIIILIMTLINYIIFEKKGLFLIRS